MTQKRDANGKFAKKKKSENPDRELASKGYVKCVARKTLGIRHSHRVSNADQVEIIAYVMAVAFAVSIFGWIFSVQAKNLENMETLFAVIFWVSALLVAACSVDRSVDINYEALSDCTPDYLKKYEPPCEPKRGCEEQE